MWKLALLESDRAFSLSVLRFPQPGSKLMPFVASYRAIEPCIVAIASRFSRGPFPEIVGTGFFTSQDGVVCTCRHVVDAFDSLPRPEGFAGTPADLLLFREVEIDGRRKWAWFTIEILAAGNATFEGGRPDFVPAEEGPDASFLLVNAIQTPSYLSVRTH